MKRCFFLLIVFMTCMFASAQDTIRFRNGRVEAAKVAEVGLGKVKYKKFNNPDGPLFLLDEIDKAHGDVLDFFLIYKHLLYLFLLYNTYLNDFVSFHIHTYRHYPFQKI